MTNGAHNDDAELHAAELSIVTTEHFVLQGARSATIAESTGRATMFLGAVSGGLVALGLVATATGFGSAFYGFALVLLPTLAFLGLVTFERALQSGLRITGTRGGSPNCAATISTGPPTGPLPAQRAARGPSPHAGVPVRRWQDSMTVAGMVAVITAVLAGSAIALLAAAASHHSLFYALVFGVPAAFAILAALIRTQHRTWIRARREAMFAEEVPEGATQVHWHAGTSGPTTNPPSPPSRSP